MKSIDLFAGAGGLSEGLSEVGFKCIYANEWIQQYAETFKLNHPDAIVDSTDIRQVEPKLIRQRLGMRKKELDLIAGGPPCQGFSINAPKRSNEDARNHLFMDFLRFVEEFLPKAVLIENVPGLVSYEQGGTLTSILESLTSLGYRADVQILYAPHFGVPQTRWRTVVLAFRGSALNPLEYFPDPSIVAPIRVNFTSQFAGTKIVRMPTRKNLRQHFTVRDAIGDLPILLNGEAGEAKKGYLAPPQNDYQRLMRMGSSVVTHHEAFKLSAINMERLKHIPPGGNWTDIPFELLPKGMQRARRTDHTKRYGRVSPEGLSSTILTKCDPHWGAYFHYEQDRVFTVREAARIQSFPDSYAFAGSKTQQYEQVGNAVPPLLGAAIGKSILPALESYETKRRKVG